MNQRIIELLRKNYYVDYAAHLLFTSLIEMGRMANHRLNLRDVVFAVTTQNGELLMQHTASEMFNLRLVNRSYTITKPRAPSTLFWYISNTHGSPNVNSIFLPNVDPPTITMSNTLSTTVAGETPTKITFIAPQPVVVFVVASIPPFGLFGVRAHILGLQSQVCNQLLVFPAPPQHEIVITPGGSGAPNNHHLAEFIDCLAGEIVAQALLACDIPLGCIEHCGFTVRVTISKDSVLVITPLLSNRSFRIEETSTGSAHEVSSLSEACKIVSRYFFLVG